MFIDTHRFRPPQLCQTKSSGQTQISDVAKLLLSCNEKRFSLLKPVEGKFHILLLHCLNQTSKNVGTLLVVVQQSFREICHLWDLFDLWRWRIIKDVILDTTFLDYWGLKVSNWKALAVYSRHSQASGTCPSERAAMIRQTSLRPPWSHHLVVMGEIFFNKKG